MASEKAMLMSQPAHAATAQTIRCPPGARCSNANVHAASPLPVTTFQERRGDTSHALYTQQQ